MSKKKLIFILFIVVFIIVISFLIGNTLMNKFIVSKEKTHTNANIEQSIENNNNVLNISKSNEISLSFPEDITEIKLVNYLSDSSNPTTYTINDIEKMKDFIQLFTSSTWIEDNTSYNNFTTFWKITIKGSTITTFNMFGVGGVNGNYGIVQVNYDNYSKLYQIPKTTYLDILSFTTEKYYLHESDLEIPNQDKCYEAQNKVFSELDENTKNEIKKEIQQIHGSLEYTLLDAVRILKDSNSPYWIRFIEPGIYEEPLDPSTKVESNGILTIYLNKTNDLLNKIKNSNVRNDLNIAYTYLKEAIDEHNIEKLFEAHKIIHDYDYWVINTPVHLDYEPADWSGVDTYFGKASILE